MEPDIESQRKRLGPVFTTGTHIFFRPLRRYGEDVGWSGVAVIEGKPQLYRRSSKSNDLLKLTEEFAKNFSTPDSIHIYYTDKAAHLAHPEFFSDPDLMARSQAKAT